MEIKRDGVGIGKYRLASRSDEHPDREPIGMCLHEHETLEDAANCLEAQVEAGTLVAVTWDAAKDKKPQRSGLVGLHDLMTPEEAKFVGLVMRSNGLRIRSCFARNDTPLWKRPEQLGLIRAVGSYRWLPTDRLIPAVMWLPLRVTVYYMHDNFMFTELKDATVEGLLESARKMALESPGGMLCPVTLIDADGNDVRRVGVPVHADIDGLAGTSEWESAVRGDDEAMRLIQSRNNEATEATIIMQDEFITYPRNIGKSFVGRTGQPGGSYEHLEFRATELEPGRFEVSASYDHGSNQGSLQSDGDMSARARGSSVADACEVLMEDVLEWKMSDSISPAARRSAMRECLYKAEDFLAGRREDDE